MEDTKRLEAEVSEPNMDLAHLGHVEILTPKPEDSLKFFTQVFGLTKSGRKGDSVYLRAWDDYERYSLQLTASPTSVSDTPLPFARAARRRCSGSCRRSKVVGRRHIGWH